MPYRIAGTIPTKLDKYIEALFKRGYTPSDIVKNAVRDYIHAKIAEGEISK